MKTETKILSVTLVIAVILLIVGVIFLSKSAPKISSSGSANVIYQIDYSIGHKIGSDSAKVKVVEFSDFQCPACKAAQPYVDQVLKENSPNLQFIYRNFPLPKHLNASAAANGAEEADAQGKFWPMHDKLFATQDSWANLPDPSDYFAKMATDLGLDGSKVKEAAQKLKYNQKIQKDISDGNSYQVNATPTFYLNGKKLELVSFQDIKNQIDQALQAAR